MAADDGIEVMFESELMEVRPDAAEAVIRHHATGQDEVLSHVLMHVAPPQSPPDRLKATPLADPANPAGCVEVDEHTMRHVRYPDVFALGDAGSTPNSKTGAAVRKRAPVLVENLLAEFDYSGRPTPSIPPHRDAARPCAVRLATVVPMTAHSETPAPFRIRPATLEDVPAVARVAALTFPDACPPTTPQEAKDEHIARNLNQQVIAGWITDGRHAVHVAVRPEGHDDAGTVLGYVMADLAPEKEPDVTAAVGADARVGCLSKLYLLPEARGTGAAAALLAAGMAAMREHGLAHAWLGTSVANHRANAFYEKVGFRTVGRRRFMVGGNPEEDNVRLAAL